MVCLKEDIKLEKKILHLKRKGSSEKHMWTSGFYRYEHIYSYRRQEFQNILERK